MLLVYVAYMDPMEYSWMLFLDGSGGIGTWRHDLCSAFCVGRRVSPQPVEVCSFPPKLGEQRKLVDYQPRRGFADVFNVFYVSQWEYPENFWGFFWPSPAEGFLPRAALCAVFARAAYGALMQKAAGFVMVYSKVMDFYIEYIYIY